MSVQVNLVQAVAIQSKLHNEIQWLEKQMKVAPEGVKVELQTMKDSKQGLYDAIGKEIEGSTLMLPESAGAYMTAP